MILGSGVTIPYKNLSDSPDLGIYISKDGEIGTISSDLTAPDGAKGYFKVSTNGLLIADNAYISGTIYAQNGTFAGELKAATGSFTGELKAATGTFAGKLSAATGSFTGEITADKIQPEILPVGLLLLMHCLRIKDTTHLEVHTLVFLD